jgi:hypothetical protein
LAARPVVALGVAELHAESANVDSRTANVTHRFMLPPQKPWGIFEKPDDVSIPEWHGAS